MNEMNIYFIKRKIYRWYFKLRKITPADMPMVKYWKTQDAVKAKVTTNKDGVQIMKLQGEDYDMMCFPRSYMLYGNYKGTGYGPLSVLKHTIKNEVFNYIWYALEDGKSKEEIIKGAKDNLQKAFEIITDLQYDLIPPEKLSLPIREIYRAMTVLEKRYPQSKSIKPLKEIITEIMAEDDSYCFRVQWIVQIFNPSAWWFKLFFRNPIKDFEIALEELEHGEVVGDMKERIRLLRKGLMFLLEDERIKKLFLEFCREVDWKKVGMTAGDKYYFRAKYFKVDLINFEY